jgi:hypothetical protein
MDELACMEVREEEVGMERETEGVDTVKDQTVP